MGRSRLTHGAYGRGRPGTSDFRGNAPTGRPRRPSVLDVDARDADPTAAGGRHGAPAVRGVPAGLARMGVTAAAEPPPRPAARRAVTSAVDVAVAFVVAVLGVLATKGCDGPARGAAVCAPESALTGVYLALLAAVGLVVLAGATVAALRPGRRRGYRLAGAVLVAAALGCWAL